jgi:hypothetical protein
MKQTTYTKKLGLLSVVGAVLMASLPSPAAEDLVTFRQADMKGMAAAGEDDLRHVQGSGDL